MLAQCGVGWVETYFRKEARRYPSRPLFYKTGHGANVGAIILSMITSCRLNRTNVWNWMVSVLKRSSEVSGNPAAFLPWVYKGEAVEEEVARVA